MGFSINLPFLDTSMYGNLHIYVELWWLTSGFFSMRSAKLTAVHPGCQSCRPCRVASLLHVAPIHTFHNNSASRKPSPDMALMGLHQRSAKLGRTRDPGVNFNQPVGWVVGSLGDPHGKSIISGISPRHRWFDRDTSPGCELSIANSTADNENWILACMQSNNQNYIVVLSIMYRNTII